MVRSSSRAGWLFAPSILATCLVSTTVAQRAVPLADSPTQPLLPAAITRLPVTLNAQLGTLFREEDGTDAAHLLGDVALRVGGGEGQELRSREAVVWINRRESEGRSYSHLQVFLWRNAEVRDIGGTVTSGPALFITLNTSGKVSVQLDNVAFTGPEDLGVVEQGRKIRQAALVHGPPSGEPDSSFSVFDTSGLSPPTPDPRPDPVIQFHSDGVVTGPIQSGALRVLTVTGGAYLSRGVAGSNEFLEIRADSVAVFLPEGADLPAPLTGEPDDQADRPGPGEDGPRPPRRSTSRTLLSAGFGDVPVNAVYLEGDVIMTQGPNMIRADRLYYDFTADRALILDAIIRGTVVSRNLPIYLRADEIRQLSTNHFQATRARFTTSEFHTPHYHVGASRIDLINRTPASPDGSTGRLLAGSFRINDATLNVGGVPLVYWPFLRGRLDLSETAVQSVRVGYSDDFGAEIETRWNAFSLLNLQTPPGYDFSLNLDYFSERGPAIGLSGDYAGDRYFGLLKSYLMTDEGSDFLGRERARPSTHDVRGRFLLRHRQFLDENWQLSLELSYLSDRSFLEEFFEHEFDHDKEQETLLHLKKQVDTWAFTALLQGRFLEFTTQTERLPDFGWFTVGTSLGPNVDWFSENRLGLVRYRPADRTLLDRLRFGTEDGSGSVGRVDSRQEFNVPLDVGPVRLVPFLTLRGTSWDDSPESGGTGRAFGSLGVRSSMYFWRTFADVRSTFWDLDGLRHVIKPDLTAWVSGSNRDAHELFPFDPGVERIHDASGLTLGFRQRWQTKRGPDDERRTVDWLTLDLEVGAFDGVDDSETTNSFASFSRPENSIARNFVNASAAWRVNDRTALLSEVNYDLNDGSLDIWNVSLAVERAPRLSYLVGYRFIDATDSSLLGVDVNYQLTEKHIVALRERFDLDRGRTLDFTVGLIRRLPRWFAALSFELDEAEDDFGVTFSMWPEGLPHAALGSRRFTGLSSTTQLQSE